MSKCIIQYIVIKMILNSTGYLLLLWHCSHLLSSKKIIIAFNKQGLNESHLIIWVTRYRSKITTIIFHSKTNTRHCKEVITEYFGPITQFAKLLFNFLHYTIFQ